MLEKMRMMGVLGCVAILAVMLPACSDDDDPMDPGGGGDTTAPQVTGITPADGQMMVDLAGMITVTFNEAMDPASAAGQITLSSGTVNTTAWTNDQTLTVTHSDWAQATNVTVTVGTGLADAAGNNIAAAVAASYWTMAETLTVMDFEPGDGATEINRSASIDLLFSEPMNAASLGTGVTITDLNKAVHPFTVEEVDGYRYELHPVEPLASNTLTTVTLGTGVQTAGGDFLAEAYSFSFTTSDAIDNTPPTIVSFDPPSGSTMPANQTAVTIVFSEPMDTLNFSPSMMNGQFAWLISQVLEDIEWSQDISQLTVPMPRPLPAGLSLQIQFSGYADANGNVQNDMTEWTSTVAGTADNYPVSDGYRFMAMGTWSEGEPGSIEPLYSGDEMIFFEFEERVAANQWNKKEFYDSGYMVLDTYEIQSVTAAGISLVGFAEDEGVGEGKVLTEYFLSSPVTWAEFPFVKGNTWSSNATVNLPDGTLSASVTGEVLDMEDLPIPSQTGGDFQIVWTDVWKVELNLTISQGSEYSAVEKQVFWYAPGVGVVHETYREDTILPVEDAGWSESDRWLYINLD